MISALSLRKIFWRVWAGLTCMHMGPRGRNGYVGRDMAGMDMSAGHMSGMAMGAAMVHANDVAYDAYLANDRTLADPEVVQVEAGARVRLRIINGGTATAFWIDPGVLNSAGDCGGWQPVSATGRAKPIRWRRGNGWIWW